MSKKSSPVIVVNRDTPFVSEAFSPIGTVVAVESSELTKEIVRNAEILIVRSETRVAKDLLEGCSVRLVGTVTIGTDHIDRDYLYSRGITFASAPGSNANSVAEYVAAGLLTWSQRTGQPLSGKSIGIVGVGNVGRKVVAVAQAFGMIPLLNDPPIARKSGDSAYVPLDDLMSADFITLHVPLTRTGPDATFHLFDEQRIGKMKRGSVLINTARGSVVKTNALRAALSSGRLSAAIVDVWENEPAINTALLDSVMIGTPHIAGYSLDGKLNALRMVYESVCRYLRSPHKWPVDSRAAGAPALLVPAHLADDQSVIAFAVRQAYNIEFDDSMLRAISDISITDRPSYFGRLRTMYRVRHEFSNYMIKLSSSQAVAGKTLWQLGFKAVVNKAAFH